MQQLRAQELVDKGYSVTDMDSKLLAQIEWLWMHMIEEKKENEQLKTQNEKLEERISRLEKLIETGK